MELEELKNIMHVPLVPNNLADFNVDEEAESVYQLILNNQLLQSYVYDAFVAPGGSGLVFKIKREPNQSSYAALKIVRKHILDRKDQSPFSNEELDALKELSHSNIVRLYDIVKNNQGDVIAVCTAYIENPQGFDLYIQEILNKIPKNSDLFGQISDERLNKTCLTIAEWVYDISVAINYMHTQGYYHMDIKPANILFTRNGEKWISIITDMGSCMKKDSSQNRVHFTWVYAHPDLTDISKGAPGSIEGGAVRASSTVHDLDRLPVYDLYALGKTILQILAIVELHYGEKCFSNYYFRYLYIISALLLDGRNFSDGKPDTTHVNIQNEIRFLKPFPMDLSAKLLDFHKIKNSDELVDRLKRYKNDYSISELATEFNARCSNTRQSLEIS